MEPVVVDDQPGDRAVDDADAPGGQELELVGVSSDGVREQGDVGGPLPQQQRVLERPRALPPRTPSGWSRTS